MTIFLNPYAHASRALPLWKSIADRLVVANADQALRIVSDWREWDMEVGAALRKGERQFVAAGGDGTVNALLNTLVRLASPGHLEALQLGAIGLGSSNDFHKPFDTRSMIDGIPVRLDFDHAQPRDIGVLVASSGASSRTRHFLLNASVGVTANANARFNTPGRFLRWLKKLHTGTAIADAALSTICRHSNAAMEVAYDGAAPRTLNVTNLAILKSPHFSGSLKFNAAPAYDSGRFSVYCSHDLGRAGMISLLVACSKAGTRIYPGTESWSASSIRVSAAEPFAVEYDGGVLTTASCLFRHCESTIKVCQP